MEKVELYINEHTRNTYNYNSYEENAMPWLSPDDTRKAVEIAREETIEEVCKWLGDNLSIYISYCERGVGEGSDEFIDDLKKHFNNK